MDYARIAETLEIAPGTVKSRLFRARLALRQSMNPADAADARLTRTPVKLHTARALPLFSYRPPN